MDPGQRTDLAVDLAVDLAGEIGKMVGKVGKLFTVRGSTIRVWSWPSSSVGQPSPGLPARSPSGVVDGPSTTEQHLQ